MIRVRKIITPLLALCLMFTPVLATNSQEKLPSDELYVFQSYHPTFVKKNLYYKTAGTFMITNTTNKSMKATYTQPYTNTIEASVTENIKTTDQIKASFLAKLEAEMDVSVVYSSTWTEGTSYGLTQTIPAKSKRIITNYAVGVNTEGTLYYQKYVNGIFAGYYTEPCGGTVISSNDMNIVITE